MAITLRATKGSPLTNAELDANFTTLQSNASAWVTYTPNVSNLVHIAMDAGAGTNVTLGAPVDNTQVVDVPLNLPDGGTMQINLTGGAGSGLWTTWSAGAPATAGWYFPGGAAPTANASASIVTPLYVKRRGAKYVAQASTLTEAV